MQEVKIFYDYKYVVLENEINEFIKDKKVIDIKYQMCCYSNFAEYSAMVVYEVKE